MVKKIEKDPKEHKLPEVKVKLNVDDYFVIGHLVGGHSKFYSLWKKMEQVANKMEAECTTKMIHNIFNSSFRPGEQWYKNTHRNERVDYVAK